MNTRNMILSGAILAIFVALVTTTVPSAFAGDSPIGAGPSPGHPQIYLIKKVMDICDHNGGMISGSDPLGTGSVPPSGQQFGCVDFLGDRFNQYLFTGESMGVLVAIRDVNGAEGIAYPVVLTVDGIEKSLCNDITSRIVPYTGAGGHYALDTIWYGHDVDTDLAQQPPAKSAGTPQGFDPAFDKLYQCVYTATELDSGALEVDIVAKDQNGDVATFSNALDLVWFNPEIMLNVKPSSGDSIAFEDGTSGQTVYSLNSLQITNNAEGGVIVYAWLAGTDLTGDALAKCPVGNVLDVESYMEYRCKIGSMFNNPWNPVPNPNDKEACTLEACQGAKPLMQDVTLTTGSTVSASFLSVGSMAECWFRLTYPVPCIGLFDQGQLMIFARAI